MRMDWIDFATRGERKTLADIEARRTFDNEVKRRIYDRCRKRMERKTKAERENARENTPANPQKSAIV